SVRSKKRPKRVTKSAALVHLQSFDTPLVSPVTGSSLHSIRLDPGRAYTVGRTTNDSCDFVLSNRLVSKQHCQVLFDSVDRRIYILDGVFLPHGGSGSGGGDSESNCVVSEFRRRLVCDGELGESVGCGGFRVRVSLNGVYINGVRIRSGMVKELRAGDEVLLGCGNEGGCGFRVRIGFLVRGVVFKEEVVVRSDEVELEGNGFFESTTLMGQSQGSVSSGKRNKRVFALPAGEGTTKLVYDTSRVKYGEVFGRAKFLLGRCREILRSDDPLSCIQRCALANLGARVAYDWQRNLGHYSSSVTLRSNCTSCEPVSRKEARPCEEFCKDKEMEDDKVERGCVCVRRDHLQHGVGAANSENAVADDICKKVSTDSVGEENAACVGGAEKIRTEKYYCPPPGKKFYLNRLQFMDRVPFDCHNTISLPELLHPVGNILRMFIATFTSDIPSHLPVTIACHNTERCWSSSPDKRTSVPYAHFPNLTVVFPPFPEAIAFGKDRKRQGIACHHPKLLVLQRKDSIRWNNVTNTIWWQDFPRRSSPDFSSLFVRLADVKVCQEFRSDFAAQLAGFMASLVIDVPSQAHWIVDLTRYNFDEATGYLIASIPGIHSSHGDSYDEQHQLNSGDVKLLGSVEASVVGLSHLFQNAIDRNGAQLKRLATFLGKSCENAYGLSEVVLRRNTNVPADPNAVSVLVSNPDQCSEGDSIQLGFLPRYVAKWVSPLWDYGFFRFSGYIYPKEACTAALGGSSTRVQLILRVTKGPRFPDMMGLMQSEHVVAFSSLIASIRRFTGLWRLQEYKWPELEESDFTYAAAGKRSLQPFDSEESDPEWGCWSASQELKNPSIRIAFPTIERVKNACNGIFPSKRILCFSEKAWQRLRTVDILRDAIPYPHDRVGHPSHVKVARRLFKRKASSFGWVYCGSHNFSAAAWGRPMSQISGLRSNQLGMTDSSLGLRLQICNYELGIVFLFPPPDTLDIVKDNQGNLDDVVLPFVVPAPKYGPTDKPATKLAMREALAELNEQERQKLVELATTEEIIEEMPDEEEEVVETPDCVVEEKEKEEEKAYAEMLWVQEGEGFWSPEAEPRMHRLGSINGQGHLWSSVSYRPPLKFSTLYSLNHCFTFSYSPNSRESLYDPLLKSSNGLGSLQQIHSVLTTNNLIAESSHLGAQIILKYAKFGDPKSARSLFDYVNSYGGEKPSSFLWNTMIRAYANGGLCFETLELYSLMHRSGISPNNYTFPFVFKACASISMIHKGRVFHGDALKTGFVSDFYVEAALVDMYATCGQLADGRKLLDEMPVKDLVCGTSMITAYEQAGLPEEALLLFQDMQNEGLLPDAVSIVSVASAVAQLGDDKRARSVHTFALRNLFLE
ncbi:hypothetical protein Tsubulata_031292, partial [Turnera subulata]